MAKKKLTQDDISRLLSDPSTDTRAETATKIAGDFNAGDLSDSEPTTLASNSNPTI